MREDTLHNWLVLDRIVDEAPSSVLHLGCGRGLILWRIEHFAKIPCLGLEASAQRYLTRVSPHVRWSDGEWPWPVEDDAFDLVFTNQIAETLPANTLPAFVKEMNRVARRGLHIVNFAASPLSPTAWRSRLGGNHQIVDAAQFGNGTSRATYRIGGVKINCGCGDDLFYCGWKNVDVLDFSHRAAYLNCEFTQYDVRKKNMTHEHHASAVVAHHLLDWFTAAEAKDFVHYCWDILMAGGVLRVSVPDLQRLETMRGGLARFDPLDPRVAAAKTWKAKLNRLARDGRKSVHTASSLKRLLAGAGFGDVRVSAFADSRSRLVREGAFDSLPDLSLYVEGSKLTL